MTQGPLEPRIGDDLDLDELEQKHLVVPGAPLNVKVLPGQRAYVFYGDTFDRLIAAARSAAALRAELAGAREREARLEGVLRFYADPKSYGEDGAPGRAVFSDVPGQPTEYDFEPDMGQRARAALGDSDDG